jgi:hypothetical protein
MRAYLNGWQRGGTPLVLIIILTVADILTDSPSASATMDTIDSSAPTITVSKSDEEDHITIRIYAKGSFYSKTGSSVLLLTAVYSIG